MIMNLESSCKSKRVYGVVLSLLLFSFAAAGAPYLVARIKAGDNWAGVTPALSNDALRYYARANDVTRGNFYPHDPYFFEHRDTPSPTPSLDDAIVAVPQLLGLSFGVSYHVSIFFWCFMFLVLATQLLSLLRVAMPISILGAFWVYAGVYNDMLRPGAMQIVFPLFLLFLILFYRFVTGHKNSIWPLALISGLGAYFYIYLLMTSFAVMGAYTLFALHSKKWAEVKRIIIAGVLGGVISLPHIVNVLYLSGLQFYQETMVRIVFLHTHWPQIEVYFYGRWMVLGMLIVFLLRRYFPTHLGEHATLFFQCVGGGVLVAMVSNVFIGRDFDIAVHIARFGIVWYLLLGVVLLMPFVDMWKKRKRFMVLLLVTGMFALLVLQMLLNLPRAMGVFSIDKKEVIAAQEYRGVIDWLAQQPESVVVGPEKLMLYLPTLAKQYVLYNSHGSLFLLSDRELRERYLLAHAFEGLTTEQFIARSSEFGGLVPDTLAKISHSRNQVCRLFSSKNKCPPIKHELDFVDVGSMKAEYDAYYPGLTLRIVQEYAKYHVRYIVSNAGELLPAGLAGTCQPAYRDRYFSVCILPGV